MEKTTTLYAEITNYHAESHGWEARTDTETRTINITDEQQAVEACRKMGHWFLSFQTHEVDVLTVDGKEYRSNPQNHSEPRYVVDGKILSAQEVLAQVPDDRVRYARYDEFREADDTKRYVHAFEDYVELKGDIKVYHAKTGEQLWPITPQAPDHKIDPVPLPAPAA